MCVKGGGGCKRCPRNAQIGRARFFNKGFPFVKHTRSYAALPAADLDWIAGPGYSLGRYILEKNHEKTNLEL